MNFGPMRTLSAVLLALSLAASARAEELLLCGWDEVFVLDISATKEDAPKKVWSWKAADREDLPAAVREKFKTTDDCRPFDSGAKIMISSSSGGCAVVERPSGRILWYGLVPNAHGIEWLPGERIVAAASTNAVGNKLILFDLKQPDQRLFETPLESAHGVVWDAARERLWALGFDELRTYRLADWSSPQPKLVLDHSHKLPDNGGHDLSAVPGSADLIVTTHDHVSLFDRETAKFRPHPQLADRAHVKGVTVHPVTGRVAFLQADPGGWWTATLRFLHPASEQVLAGQRLYRPRWLVAPASK